MAIETVIDVKEGLVRQVLRGDLVLDEVIEAQRSLYQNPDHDPATPVLWDARGGRPTAARLSDISLMVEGSTDFWNQMSGGRTAILVASDDDESLGEAYRNLAAAMPRGLAVFRDYDEAIAWLHAV